ncbi:hypothetical protein BKA23_1147 [Rudaeicoccus suwonensis]|uniref:Uncharacterized protein n=1 Tax=Rudaeicoccus suwonensis TaxID=657409 RepID=A0A561E9P7_9MICO|nr:hypothetical protein BKA23_1147 [Rudaeicoccus suwonensis]
MRANGGCAVCRTGSVAWSRQTRRIGDFRVTAGTNGSCDVYEAGRSTESATFVLRNLVTCVGSSVLRAVSRCVGVWIGAGRENVGLCRFRGVLRARDVDLYRFPGVLRARDVDLYRFPGVLRARDVDLYRFPLAVPTNADISWLMAFVRSGQTNARRRVGDFRVTADANGACDVHEVGSSTGSATFVLRNLVTCVGWPVLRAVSRCVGVWTGAGREMSIFAGSGVCCAHEMSVFASSRSSRAYEMSVFAGSRWRFRPMPTSRGPWPSSAVARPTRAAASATCGCRRIRFERMAASVWPHTGEFAASDDWEASAEPACCEQGIATGFLGADSAWTRRRFDADSTPTPEATNPTRWPDSSETPSHRKT